jgi:hypothetical protein
VCAVREGTRDCASRALRVLFFASLLDARGHSHPLNRFNYGIISNAAQLRKVKIDSLSAT